MFESLGEKFDSLLRKLQGIKDVRNVWRVTKREAKVIG